MWALITILLLPFGASPEPNSTNYCVTTVVDDAYQIRDVKALTLHADIEAATAGSADIHRAAFAYYRLGLLSLIEDDERAAKRSAKLGLKLTDKLAEPSADDLALIGALYSIRIRTSAMSAIFLGKKSEKLVDRGLVLEPENPRALLIKSTATFFKPGAFGGGVEQALPLLESTRQAYDRDSAEQSICWGRLDLIALDARIAVATEDEELLKTSLDALQAASPNHPELLLLAKDEITPQSSVVEPNESE